MRPPAAPPVVPERLRSLPLLLAAAVVAGCAGGGSGGGGGSNGLAASAGGGPAPTFPPGPAVMVGDGTAGSRLSPFPDDDRFTVSAPTPTGRRLVAPIHGSTALELRFADELARLDGFGVFSPIRVSFDAALDPSTIGEGTVLLVHAGTGQRVPLDLGRGSYITNPGGSRSVHPRDPFSGTGDLFHPPGGPGIHYDVATRTLTIRPLVPLEPGTRYVVVLTEGLRDASGAPVAPPVGWVRPSDPATDNAILAALAGHPLGLFAVRYQWSFTTGHPTRELLAAIDALDGAGPLASALAAVPPRISLVNDLGTTLADGSPYTLDQGQLGPIIGAIAELARLAAPLDPKVGEIAGWIDFADLSCMGYILFGAAEVPELRDPTNETWDVDLDAGTAQVRAGRVPFCLITPQPCAANGFAQPPYPIVLFGHGSERSRIDAIALAGRATRNGWAVLAFDMVNHGPDDAIAMLPGLLASLAKDFWSDLAVRAGLLALAAACDTQIDLTWSVKRQADELLRRSPLGAALTDGRADDVDGDGLTDSGGRFFTADVLRTRDALRQTALDASALLRAFQALGVDRNGNGRLDPDEGDFDQDGALDVGGPGSRAAYVGISQGGILGSVLAAADPRIDRADLMVPGGGLVDIVGTTSLGLISRRVFDDVFGPVVVGQPTSGGAGVAFHRGGGAGALPTAAGGTVRLQNLATGGGRTAAVASDGGFFVQVAADAGDVLDLESFDASGASLGSLSLTSPLRGLGAPRASAEMREFMALAAMGIEAADPIAYAPLWRTPAPGRGLTDVLVQLSVGDRTVPVATGLALARAGGLLSPGRNDLLISLGVTAGGTQANPDRTHGVESTAGAGLRILGVNAHAGMLVPNLDDPTNGTRYASAAQDQAFIFLETGRIEDGFSVFDIVIR